MFSDSWEHPAYTYVTAKVTANGRLSRALLSYCFGIRYDILPPEAEVLGRFTVGVELYDPCLPCRVRRASRIRTPTPTARAFSDKAQKPGMTTLFSMIPNLKVEDYAKGTVGFIGTLLGLFLLHIAVSIVSLRWRKKLPNGSPIKYFLVAFFVGRAGRRVAKERNLLAFSYMVC